MGGADAYCALCGGPFNPRSWQLEEDDAYDSPMLEPGGNIMSWLGDARVVCENPESQSRNKVYISGLASFDDNGFFDVQAGADPNFPKEQADYINTWTSSDPFAIPFHSACYNLLCEAVRPRELDKKILYETLKSLAHTEGFQSVLNIDYGVASRFQQQYWECSRGYEYLLFSPWHIPRLQEYYETLPKLTGPSKAIHRARNTDSHDLFGLLAPETRLLMIDFLDITDVLRLRTASSSVRDVELSDSFWRLRVQRDLPWLYDMPTLSSQVLIDAIDWKQLYKDMHLASNPLPHEARVAGLANRRRIWEQTLMQIAGPYRLLHKAKSMAAPDPVTFDGATATISARLILPEPTQVKVLRRALIEDFAGLVRADPTLLIDWSNEGDLVDVQVANHHIVPTSETSDQVKVSNDDWIAGFVTTTKEDLIKDDAEKLVRRIIGLEILFCHHESVKLGKQNGDKRLVHVSESNFAVGFQAEASATDGRLSKLCILQQPCSKVCDVPRIMCSARLNPGAGKLLWRNNLPPPKLCVSPCSSGHWKFEMQPDLCPMEALLFGTTDAELADMTAISVDVQFGGFRIVYGRRPTRSIGPRLQALKTLAIDGRNGERVVSITQTTGHHPGFIRFVTNKNRQLVVGHQEGQKVNWPSNGALAGIYCLWSMRHDQKSILSAIGYLYSDSQVHAGAISPPTGQTDANGFFWEPSAPQGHLSAFGTVWGQCDKGRSGVNRARPRPGPLSIISFLDCSRPVANISSTTCHATWKPQLTLCGITFRYADNGEEVSLGSSIFPQTSGNTEGTGSHLWCWCEYAQKDGRLEQEMANTPHYTRAVQEEPSCLQLRSLRIWLAKEGDLLALQFCGNGGPMPIITGSHKELGQPSGEISFAGRGRGGDATGLKFFFNADNRFVSREDSVVVAVQAMRVAQ
ncbi:hypothetical protein C2857_006678 [Epichloe festucae Fl1]|uniref:F-box domain-containing protein n=1 Tax=Epichloe festucae (strain Fl1) TaxID=877507 RepID=A0A7S9PUQ7_EPIFF|nr:hypothetical protein C2857_006678 [Epichloe festucae Fl1]